MRYVLLTFAALTACSPSAADFTGSDATSMRVDENSLEALGLLSFLNDASTDVAVLDFDVPLNKRAAEALIAHRDGADGVFGTSDDDLFGSVAEVDATYYVGTSALAALDAYVDATGWIPSSEEHLGIYEGVDFTVEEAQITIDFVNDAAYDTLDIDAELDRRAVDSIMAARPVPSLIDLVDLYYVGGSAVDKLRVAALEEAGIDPYEDEGREGPPCDVSTTSTSNPDADDLNTLLDNATMGDWAYAEVISLQLDACPDWQEYGALDVSIEMWNATFWHDYTTAMGFGIVEFGEYTEGGDEFADLLRSAAGAIEEGVSDGDWDPSATAEDQALYDSRNDLVANLIGSAETSPEDYIELPMHLEAVECSEEASALIHITTGEVLIVHHFPGC